jgi:hypothetical protein
MPSEIAQLLVSGHARLPTYITGLSHAVEAYLGDTGGQCMLDLASAAEALWPSSLFSC